MIRMYRMRGSPAEVGRIVSACFNAGYIVTPRQADEAWNNYSYDRMDTRWWPLSDHYEEDGSRRPYTDEEIVKIMEEYA